MFLVVLASTPAPKFWDARVVDSGDIGMNLAEFTWAGKQSISGTHDGEAVIIPFEKVSRIELTTTDGKTSADVELRDGSHVALAVDGKTQLRGTNSRGHTVSTSPGETMSLTLARGKAAPPPAIEEAPAPPPSETIASQTLASTDLASTSGPTAFHFGTLEASLVILFPIVFASLLAWILRSSPSRFKGETRAEPADRREALRALSQRGHEGALSEVAPNASGALSATRS